MTKKLTEAQQFILQLLGDKGSRHRDWIVDICKQRGYRVVNRSLNSLVEQGYLSVDEDDYVTAGRAELAASAGDAGESVTAANLRQALREAKAGQTFPVATLWDGVGDAAFKIGQRVRIKEDQDMSWSAGFDDLDRIRKHRIVGTVAKLNEYGDSRLSIDFDGYTQLRYFLLPIDLEHATEPPMLPDDQRYQAEDKDALISELQAKLARAEAALVEHRKQLQILIDYVDANAQILDLPMGLRMRIKPVKALLSKDALAGEAQ